MIEGVNIEFKRAFTEDIKKTVIAFANSSGGVIYIGIQDDGKVCGITDGDEILLQTTNTIRDTIRPDVTLFTNCRLETMDEKTVIIVTVEQGTARPYYIGKKGLTPLGVYVRQGASSVPATEFAILNMIKESSGDCYETARSLNQQLTFEKTSAFFKTNGVDFGKNQKLTLGLIDRDNIYTNLALLLSEQCTHTIKLALFEGTEKTIFKERREFSGSLFQQLEDSIAYIDRHNRTRSQLEGLLYRVDQRDYPEEAIREALLNAVVHRDYAYSGSTLISLFDDRIEFVTIGGLVEGVAMDDLEIGVSMPRNQKLANVFYRLNLIEAYGTGVLKIRRSYKDFPEEPRLQVATNSFKITLPNLNTRKEKANAHMNYIDELTKKGYTFVNESRATYTAEPTPITAREVEILNLFEKQPSIVRKDIEEATGLSQATAIILLREMTRKGLLTKIGNGKLIKYELRE